MIVVTSSTKSEHPKLAKILELAEFGDQDDVGFFKDIDRSLISPSVHDRVFFRSLCTDIVKTIGLDGQFPPSFVIDLMKKIGLYNVVSIEQKAKELASMMVGVVIDEKYIHELHDVTKNQRRQTLVRIIYREHVTGPNALFKIEIPFAVAQQKAFDQALLMQRVRKK